MGAAELQMNPDGAWHGPGQFAPETLKYFDFHYKGMHAEKTGFVPSRQLIDDLTNNEPSLTVLNCENRGLDDKALAFVLKHLKGNTTVTELKIGRNLSLWNEQGDEACCTLAEILTENKTITKVDIRNNDFHEKGIIALSKALCTNSTVTWLHMGDSFSRKDGTTAIARMLEVNNTIAFLNMNVNQIQDDEAQDLLDVLYNKNTSVKEFLAYNNVIIDVELRKRLKGFKRP